ncbi:MAG: type II toxin-antitoxin system VapC family toxin [Proteobacteria bacterium]|nr:type II toxin-antitoxin system VapC family toxin [Pseudomonadota bacterium]
MKKYVLDSYAMIAFFEDEIGADNVGEILHEICRKQAKGFMSVVNWGEMVYITLQEAGPANAQAVMDQFKQYPIQLIDADKSITLQAAASKPRKTPIAVNKESPGKRLFICSFIPIDNRLKTE